MQSEITFSHHPEVISILRHGGIKDALPHQQRAQSVSLQGARAVCSGTAKLKTHDDEDEDKKKEKRKRR